MEPITLSNLDPASVDPSELVDRNEDARWLRDGLNAWLGNNDPRVGGSFCVVGDKGIGKSILTRRVIDDLRDLHTATTVFLTIDCRPLRGQRDVYREAASQLVADLAARSGVIKPLEDEARCFDTLTRFDKVELSTAHELLVQFKASLDIGGSTSLAKWLDSRLGISLSRDSKTIEKLVGSISVDSPRLQEAFVQLLADIERHSELRVVLYLDNIEELNHEALRQEQAREAVRADVEALLHLSEAACALVLNMRTYYSSILTRRISKRRRLGPMPAEELREIFARRLAGESEAVRAGLAGHTAVEGTVEALAGLATTPLAFLTWLEFVLDGGSYGEADMAAVLHQRLRVYYSTVARVVPTIATLFDAPDDRVDAQTVLAACEGSDSLYRQLIDQQILLPHNYWDPREFTLDPELSFLIGRRDLVEA